MVDLYVKPSISGYNSSPPSDEGSTTAANTVKWSTIKTKLPDPIKNLVDSMNTLIDAGFDSMFGNAVRADSSGGTMTTSDYGKLIKTTNAITVTLPTATDAGGNFCFSFYNADANSDLTIGRNGASINGAASDLTISPGTGGVVFCDGTNWWALKTIGLTGNVVIAGTSASSAELRLSEDTDNGTNYTGLKAAASISANTSFVLPSADGTAGQYLKTDGSATLAFQTPRTITAEQSTAAGNATPIDFTGIPAGVKEIKIMFVGTSTSGTSPWLIQVGDAGGFEDTSYVSEAVLLGGANNYVTGTAGFVVLQASVAADAYRGAITLSLQKSSNFTWVETGLLSTAGGGTSRVHASSGAKALSAELTQVRLTTVNGTDNWDAGVVSISYTF